MITRTGRVSAGNMVFHRFILASAMGGLFAGIIASANAQTTGPSSSERPHLLGAAADVETVSLLTVEHTVGG